jgi:hypothetical protein
MAYYLKEAIDSSIERSVERSVERSLERSLRSPERSTPRDLAVEGESYSYSRESSKRGKKSGKGSTEGPRGRSGNSPEKLLTVRINELELENEQFRQELASMKRTLSALVENSTNIKEVNGRGLRNG